jgi:tetratricopeptide (TPR) repeat protein
MLTIADTANSHISGDNVGDIFSRIDAVQRFMQEWGARGFPDDSTAARYYQVLSNLGLHRLVYAVHPENGIDSQPLIEATREHLEQALEFARKSSLPLQGGIMADLVDVYLMAGQYREATKLAQALYDEFPLCPLVPGVWLKMGIAHKNLSNIERSMEWLSKVLVHFPGSYAALQAQALLGDQLLDYGPVSEKVAATGSPDSPAGPSPAPGQDSAAGEKGQENSSVSASSGAPGQKGLEDVSVSPPPGAAEPPGTEEQGPLAKGSGLVGHQATWLAWTVLTAVLLTCLAAALYWRWVRVKPLKGGEDVA